MRVEHWNANTGYYRESDRSGMPDEVTRAFGRLIAAAGALGVPAPLRDPDDTWQLEVLAHPHGPRVLKARIVAPEDEPVAVLAVAEGGGAGARRAWRETVEEAPWLHPGCDLTLLREPPDGPWVIMALLLPPAIHGEAVEWLEDMEQCIAWAFLKSLPPMASA
ncbi:MAG: hypothetical protein F4Z59_07175 [Gemmatimonadales bacterium]|nr:hypothetical protein [Gemmatimonadales bacterium]